jgi:hypothetical protein
LLRERLANRFRLVPRGSAFTCRSDLVRSAALLKLVMISAHALRSACPHSPCISPVIIDDGRNEGHSSAVIFWGDVGLPRPIDHRVSRNEAAVSAAPPPAPHRLTHHNEWQHWQSNRCRRNCANDNESSGCCKRCLCQARTPRARGAPHGETVCTWMMPAARCNSLGSVPCKPVSATTCHMVAASVLFNWGTAARAILEILSPCDLSKAMSLHLTLPPRS